MIEARELTERYGDKTAVGGAGPTVAPGSVTGSLGPNGAGTSTTMRMIMGVDRSTSGSVVNGEPSAVHRSPLSVAGRCSTPRAGIPAAPAALRCCRCKAVPQWAAVGDPLHA